jgi:Ca2+-transporting ATPase
VGALLQWIIVSVPALAGVFRVASLSGRDWGIALGLSLVPVVLNELVKLARRVGK